MLCRSSPLLLILLSLFTFSFVLVLLISTTYAANCGGNITCSCGDTLNESRTLNASDSLTDCSDTGLFIDGSGIMLDCTGYVINGTGGSSTIGVKINYASNDTIVKNCIIHSFGTGIYGNESVRMNLTNNTMYNLSNYNGAGIHINGDETGIYAGANITNNNITSETGSGIFCSLGTVNVINNSIIGYDYGIESGLAGGWGQIQGNNITTTYSLSGYVVFINSGSPNITENNITGGYYGLYLYTSGSPKVWRNNIYGQSNYKVYSQYAINLSYNNEGNYWGRTSCPTFIAGTDSNRADAVDYYPYNTSNGWLTVSPFSCGPVISDVTSGSISPSGATITWTTDRNTNSSVNYGTNAYVLGSTSTSSSYATSHSITLNGLLESTLYYYNVTSYDQFGNFQTNGTYNFTTSATPTTTTTTAPTRIGGGADVIWKKVPKKTQIWTQITPGSVTIMKITDPEIGFKQISITVKNPAQTVTITVTKLDGKPASVVHEITGKVYKYIDIDAKNINETHLDNVKIQFQVSNSWIKENNIDPDTVALNRYRVNAWERLQTRKTGEDSEYTYYEAETPGFSTFAITGEEILVATTVTMVTTVPVTTITSPPITHVEDNNWIIGLVVIVILVIGILVWKNRLKKRKRKR